MAPPPSITVLPSPIRVLRQVMLGSIVGVAGLAVMIVFLEYLGQPWLLAHARVLIVSALAIGAVFSGFAVFGALQWRRPRVEIGPDGFVTFGITSHRPRRWINVEGDFVVTRMALQPAVAYRLTDAFKQSLPKPPPASPTGTDEAITFCGELTMGAKELADLLNQRKQASTIANAVPT